MFSWYESAIKVIPAFVNSSFFYSFLKGPCSFLTCRLKSKIKMEPRVKRFCLVISLLQEESLRVLNAL